MHIYYNRIIVYLTPTDFVERSADFDFTIEHLTSDAEKVVRMADIALYQFPNGNCKVIKSRF